MCSLQKPRKLTLVGSDGNEYSLLLKPNDDCRIDLRFMEFSSVLKEFLHKDPESRRRQLTTRTYCVIPLNENTGLIGKLSLFVIHFQLLIYFITFFHRMGSKSSSIQGYHLERIPEERSQSSKLDPAQRIGYRTHGQKEANRRISSIDQTFLSSTRRLFPSAVSNASELFQSTFSLHQIVSGLEHRWLHHGTR